MQAVHFHNIPAFHCYPIHICLPLVPIHSPELNRFESEVIVASPLFSVPS